MSKDSLNLLIELCSIQSSSTDDKDIMSYIKKYIKHGLSLEYTEDDYGNIYVTKGTGKNGYKVVVSHTDTVHQIYSYRKVFLDNGYLFAMGCANENSILRQVGIGGDDRVGNFVCLKALQDFDDIKAVFFRFEETGCRGSKAANMSFFNDCNFVIQADSRGYGDFIRNSKGIEMCSDDFVNEMEPIFKKYNYKIVNGISTDVNQLKENGLEVCAINLGCGYYEPHSDREVIYIPNVIACYDLITEMFNTYGEKCYKHSYTKPTYFYETRYTDYTGSRSTLLGSRSFTNTTNSNFFKNRLLEDLFVPFASTGEDIIDKLTEGCYKNFWVIEGDKEVYYYTDTKPIEVSPSIMYVPLEDIFYDIKDNSHILDPDQLYKLKQRLSILDGDTEFVFSNLYDYWIIRNNARWDVILETWVLKDEKYK